MATVFGPNKTNHRVLANVCGQKGFIRYERIVLCSDHEHRYAHLPDDFASPRGVVIFLRVSIPKRRRCDLIVKLTYRPNLRKTIARIDPREQLGFAVVTQN